MTSYQESDILLRQEEAMHQYVLGPWSADHSDRPGSIIRQRSYDRDHDSAQRLTTYRTPPKSLATYLPGRILGYKIQEKLAGTFDSPETAAQMVGAFRNRPASKLDDTPLLEKVSEIIDSGDTLNVVDAHYEFTGGIRLLAAFQAALRSGKYIRRTNTLISKTMTREEIDGKSIAELVRPVSGIIWVMPDTASYEEITRCQDLDEETVALIEAAGKEVNRGGMRELKHARKLGGILQWAPFSSALIRDYDAEDNLIGLKTPTMPAQIPGLMGRSRYTLPMAYFEDESDEVKKVKWAVGDLIDRDMIQVESRKVREGIYLERVIGALCTMQARISGVNVEHLGKIFEPVSSRIDAPAIGNL